MKKKTKKVIGRRIWAIIDEYGVAHEICLIKPTNTKSRHKMKVASGNVFYAY